MAGDGTEFVGFGDSILVPAVRRPVQQLALKRQLAASRQLIRQNVPAEPGVYGWLDRHQRLIYVGKSKSLRTRLVSYYLTQPADPKMVRIRHASTRLIWEPISHELLALIREQELIYRWQPIFNRQGQPQRRRPGFVGITQGVAPRVVMVYQRSPKLSECYGPVLGTGRLRDAVDAVNHAFGLRDCSDRVRMHLTHQLPLLQDMRSAQCIRHELGSCLGPCVGSCEPREYQQAVSAVGEFLRGENRQVLDNLQTEFQSAVESLVFERAAVLHNQIQSLTWLWNRLSQWRITRQQVDGSYRVSTFADQDLNLVFHQGSLAGYGDHPHSKRLIKPHSLRRMERDDHALEMEIFLIISAWFRKHREERLNVIPRDAAATDRPPRGKALRPSRPATSPAAAKLPMRESA